MTKKDDAIVSSPTSKRQILFPAKKILKSGKQKKKDCSVWRCAECGLSQSEDSFSTKNGKVVCTYPCFIKCLNDLPEEPDAKNDQFLKHYMLKLDAYNSYYSDDPQQQIHVIDDGKSVLMEMIINITWSFNQPILLDGVFKNISKIMNFTAKSKYINFSKTAPENIPVPVLPDCKTLFATMVDVPKGHVTPLKIGNQQDTVSVISLLLSNFLIINDPSMFSLYHCTTERGMRKILPSEIPLFVQLRAGPKESDGRILIASSNEVILSKEVHTYTGLPYSVLKGLLQCINKEELKNVSLVDDLFEEYKNALIDLVNEERVEKIEQQQPEIL